MAEGRKNLQENETIEFQPVTYESKEKFRLWDNQAKKFLTEKDLIDTENGKQPVTRYIRLTDDEKKRYTRSLKASRVIKIGGKEFFYDFSVTCEKRIKELFTTIENMDGNPLNYTFKMTRTGTGLKTAYDIQIVPQKNTTFSKASDDDIVVESDDDRPELNERERKIMSKIDEKASGRTKDEKKIIFMNNGVDEARATAIVNAYY